MNIFKLLILPLLAVLIIIVGTFSIAYEVSNSKTYIESTPKLYTFVGTNKQYSSELYFREDNSNSIFNISVTKVVAQDFLENNKVGKKVELYTKKYHYKESFLETFITYTRINENGILTEISLTK